uniref:SLC12 domain-containing protein n=1 Tax=Heterorhabditis bacteriophora TaxID=37862 RepID=A0A1I7WJT6_HETBA
MLDIAWLCGVAIRSVYWLVLLACNFLGYSTLWAENQLKQRAQQDTRNLTSHLAVLYSDRKVNKAQLVSFLELCLSFGARRLSIFDPWNDILSFSEEFHVICKKIHLVTGCLSSSSTPNITHRLTVHLLPANSGKSTLVELCKEVRFCQHLMYFLKHYIKLPLIVHNMIIMFQLSSSAAPITVSLVTEHLFSKYSLCEPELLIQFSLFPLFPLFVGFFFKNSLKVPHKLVVAYNLVLST